MLFRVTLISMLLFSSIAQAQYSSKRKLLLVTDNILNAHFLEEEKMLQTDSAGIKERDLTITTITPSNNKAIYSKWMNNNKGFRLILIGKDGGEKFTSDTPVSCQQLYAIIDAMPMRQQEIKSGKHN